MTSLDSWVVAAAHALGLRADEIPADLRKGLLDLVDALPAAAGPLAGPMTGYALGLAVGRGAAPTAALSSLGDLAGEWSRQHADEEQTREPAGPPAPGADPEVPIARARQLARDGGGNSTEPGAATQR